MPEQNLTETFESQSYGQGFPQPYPFGMPEELPRNAVSPALTKSIVAFTGSGRLIGFTVTNTNAAAQFVQVFNAIAVPATGAIPLLSKSCTAADATAFFFGESGRWFTAGCVFAISSTSTSLTPAAANDCFFDVQYVPQVI